MTAIIDGSNGVTTPNVITSPSGSTLQLQSNGGVTAITIDTSQNVGIGTSSPVGKVDIASTSTTAPVFRALNNGANWSQMLCGYNGTSTNYYDADTQIFRNGATQTERMRIDSSGNLLAGTTSYNYSYTGNAIQFNAAGYGIISHSSTATYNALVFNNGNGQVGAINTSGSTTIYGTSSDYRLKHDVQPMTNALQRIASLKPVTYKWIVDGSDGEGFIAHELAEVCPHAVTGEKDAVDENGNPKYQGIDTSFLVATLTAAIQELNATITDMAAKLKAAGVTGF